MVARKTMWQNLWAYQIIASNPCPHINTEKLLVLKINYAMRILLCPLVMVVNTDEALSTETCFFRKEH
jgi:hypothetical protein